MYEMTVTGRLLKFAITMVIINQVRDSLRKSFKGL